MTLTIPGPPTPPKKLTNSSFEYGIFTAASTLTFIGVTVVGHGDLQVGATAGATAGAAAVGVKRSIQGIAPAIYARTPWGKRAALDQWRFKVQWFSRVLHMHDRDGFLDRPKDQAMVSEMLALSDAITDGLSDISVIEEIYNRNFALYQERMRKWGK